MPGRRRPYRRIPAWEKNQERKNGESRDGRIIYLRCQKRTICQGTAKMVDGVIHDLNAHSEYCLPDNSEDLIARFKEALAEALPRHCYKLKPLYESLAAVHAEAAALKSYESLRSFMKKCRRRYPPNPENSPQFVDQLLEPENEGLSEYDAGRLTVQLITDGNGNIQQNAMAIKEAARQSPSQEDIEDIASLDGATLEAVNSVDELADNTPESRGSPLRSRSPTGSPTRTRRRRRTSERHSAPVEPASEKNRKRNKRRKVMRRRALARLREGAAQNAEANQLRTELEEVRTQLQAVENRLRMVENNVS